MTGATLILINLAITLAQTAAAPTTVDVLSTASGPVMLAIVIIALSTRKLVLPRELDYRDQRIADMTAEHARQIARYESDVSEFKRIAFGALRVGEKAADFVEERGR